MAFVLFLAAFLNTEVAAQGDAETLPWENIGPGGSQSVTALALSPRWPSDPTIVAATRAGHDSAITIVRTSDGGQTWERSQGPTTAIAKLVLPDGQAGRRVVFALDNWQMSSETSRLYRSPDGGETWQESFTLPIFARAERGQRELVTSPAFGTDGIAYIVADGRLYRSDDGGAAWTPQEPVPGQRVQQIVFSPAFASDATLFLSVTSSATPEYIIRYPQTSDPLPTDHERSIGILKSTDRGATWTPAATGLEVDGLPYRQVSTLVISPTFGTDGILFAYGWGPWEDVQLGAYTYPSGPERGQPVMTRVVHTALFRSSDGGTTWNTVLLPPWKPTNGGIAHYLRFGLSKTFEADGSATLAVNGYVMGGGSGWCDIRVTTDRGATWESLGAPKLEQGRPCFQILTGSGKENRVVFAQQCQLGVGCPQLVWSRSRDGGRTWQRLAMPGALQYVSGNPMVAGDGTAFFGGQGGIWKLSATAPSDSLP